MPSEHRPPPRGGRDGQQLLSDHRDGRGWGSDEADHHAGLFVRGRDETLHSPNRLRSGPHSQGRNHPQVSCTCERENGGRFTGLFLFGTDV